VIDFSAIHAFNNGQRDSFEQLVVVLAKREPPKGAAEFQSYNGSGGDGGVEAIWLLSDGSKIGYQAKFHLAPGNQNWPQMDDSVKQALDVHPELQSYIFAVPRDLTPDRGRKTKGKSEQKKWNEHVQKWKSWAKAKNIEIEFELWSATILFEKLLREENSNLIKHWFGGDVLNEAWFSNHIDNAQRALDDRFNPDDHVPVSIEALFDTMARGPGITEKLSTAFAELEKSRIPSFEFTIAEHAPGESLLIATEARQQLLVLKGTFQHDIDKKWEIGPVADIQSRLQKAVSSLENQYLSIDKENTDDKYTTSLNYLLERLSELSAACYSIKRLIDEPNLRAEAQQCAVVYGPAGAGKSHILGQVAADRSHNGLPTVLLLGERLSNSVFWEQVGAVLGLEGRTVGDVLGVLSAAGERKGERTVLLFDAINEGVGAQYWMQNLPEIIHAIQCYPNLAAVFSCREEYLPFAVPNGLSEKIPKFKINGFSSQQEMEQAAIQYLDKKGIARPNTPWLSPEFSNPLFLKSASEALQAKGSKEFPLGLQGISQLMALYLDALSWRTGTDTTSASISKCVRLVATRMASEGCDFVEIDEATTIANESFRGRTAPEGKTWLQVLIDASLFRRDPPPYSDDIDPLAPPSERIRFAFQRFQDHLMALSLVSKVADAPLNEAFEKGAPLNFLFFESKQRLDLRFEYAGLIGALSTIYPEKLGVEFAKTLPNWEQQWVNGYLAQESFAESFKWRSVEAFTDDTRELLNQLNEDIINPLELLIEVSMTVDHPFNALRLHSILKQYPMPERDSHWTHFINWTFRSELSQVDRIVSWALSLLDRPADDKHLELASLVLTWLLSSSYMTLRDRATKALTVIFLADKNAFFFVHEKMHDCDDPYILERLYAAAFGACCIDQHPDRLTNYSREVFDKVFADKQPPVAILTRDYALGIVELAASKGVLANEVILEDCHYPFRSKVPELNLTEEKVEQIAEESGDKTIFRSASNEWGDYGKYSIPNRVNCFTNTPLSQAMPVSKQELKHAFIEDVITPCADRVEALKAIEEITNSLAAVFVRNFQDYPDQPKTDMEAQAFIEKKLKARSQLEELLSDTDKTRLSVEYFQDNMNREDFDKVCVQRCRFWIVKRAYELGWTSELFPNDHQGTNYSRHHNDFERIGKKYQRIALDEIQARLADNYWALDGWPEQPCVFRYSHQDFRRNLEPTILPTDSQSKVAIDQSGHWINEPIIKLPEVVEDDLKSWPFSEDPTQSMTEKLTRVDEDGQHWSVLYEFNCDTQKYEDSIRRQHGLRYEEFRFFYCVFVKKGKARELAEFLREKDKIDGHSFNPVEYTDGPYLLEAYWRNSWNADKFTDGVWKAPDGCDFAIPVASYTWESHLDKSLPEGFSCYLPQKWLADELELSMSKNGPSEWLNKSGNVVIQTQSSCENRSAVVIAEEILNDYGERFNIEPVWLMIAERNAWPDGENSEFHGRRSEGAIWQEDGSWRETKWNRDTKKDRI